MEPAVFITGIGTGVGKTVVAAIVAEALRGRYWKPVQAGYDNGTDTEWVAGMLSTGTAAVYPEAYRLKMAASPHIAAREKHVRIDLQVIKDRLEEIQSAVNSQQSAADSRQSDISANKGLPTAYCPLIIEGAGGLLVPLNETEFVADLIQRLNARVLLVSRNYLGSINHSLMTAEACKQYKLDVIGWIFNDQYMAYEEEIVHWSGFPKIASIPFAVRPDRQFVQQEAERIRESLKKIL